VSLRIYGIVTERTWRFVANLILFLSYTKSAVSQNDKNLDVVLVHGVNVKVGTAYRSPAVQRQAQKRNDCVSSVGCVDWEATSIVSAVESLVSPNKNWIVFVEIIDNERRVVVFATCT
jgi:hypothetical protein